MTTNLDAAAEVMAFPGDPWGRVELAWAQKALDAVDPRLKLLTPEDTTAILDWMAKWGSFWLRSADGSSSLPLHVWEVLS